MKYITLIAALAASILLVAMPPASAQVVPYSLTSATNVPAKINAATISNINSIVSIPAHGGVAVSTRWYGGVGTSNISVAIYRGVDGTNFASPAWTTWTFNANGTSTNTYTTNWTADELAGYTQLNFYSVSNQNATAITNVGGIQINRVFR